MIKLTIATVAAALLIPCACLASPQLDAVDQCMSDNTTGKDRKDLARWIFVAIAAHPELKALAEPTPAMVESSQKAVGELITRLLGTTCKEEMHALVKSEGSIGARVAFEHLGKIAMAEIMSSPKVTSAISGFERYVDRAKIDPVMKP